MKNYFVLVVNGSRARFFTLQPADNSELESGPNLVQLGNSENEVAAQPGRAVFTDEQHRNRAPMGGAHGYDDHRDKHDEEFRKRFVDRVMKLARGHLDAADILVVAANPRMLGHLRTALKALPTNGTELREYPHDVSKLSPRKIHEHLASGGLVPERRDPTQATPFRE